MHYLYKIINTENAKVYIGQTVNPSKRWYAHKTQAADPKYPIHCAIKKYGNEKFNFEIIACCLSQDDCDCLEIELIKQYDSRNKEKGYNIAVGGNAGHLGLKRSDDIKQKMSISHKGNKSRTGITNSPEMNAKISASLIGNTYNLGKKLTEEHKTKISWKGRKHSEETKAKMSAWQKGKPKRKKADI